MNPLFDLTGRAALITGSSQGIGLALMREGLAVSLASDDPPMFATSLVEEYRRCAAAYGWDAAQVCALAAAAVRHSFLEEPRKAALLAEQDAVAATLGLV